MRKNFGVAGFEPAASASRTQRDTKLRYTPMISGQRARIIYEGDSITKSDFCVFESKRAPFHLKQY